MVPQVATTRSLETLPARPPTPPRERAIDPDGLAKQKQLLVRHPLDPRSNLQTPPSHSPGSSDLSDATSGRVRKRVDFSGEPQYRDPPTYTEDANKRPTPVSASSAASSSGPVKSILKPSAPVALNSLHPSSNTGDSARYANLATMLDSTIKQLAGADLPSRVDAYEVLVQALKASNNLPDRIALHDKMSLFTQFIQRDITMKTSDALESRLVKNALALLNTFLHFSAIASTISNDFGSFFIDHCTKSFEDPSTGKDVARHLMQACVLQNFSAKVMTADRVGRLVTSLHNIEEHLEGKSIVMARVRVYRRLVQHCKGHMVSHTEWLYDLFTDMLSSLTEIQTTAIAMGMEASFTIGKEKQLSRKVMEVLQSASSEVKYIEYYVDRLKVMAKDKKVSATVPQIWSVVILLMRCPVEKWDFFGRWLEIIQLCFNSSDWPTRHEANYAWNRFVYVLQLNDQSLSKMAATICGAFASQLKRRNAGKQSEEFRRVVLGSVCNLYYYALKPNTSATQLDSLWDALVRPLLLPLASPTPSKSAEKNVALAQNDVNQAALILTGMFDSSTPRIWREDRVADHPLAKPEELPSLDSKWLRRNASRVFELVDPRLSTNFLDLADPKSTISKLGRALVGAVAFAASKEVKVSTDTAIFMASAFTSFSGIWSRGPQESQDGQRFLEATQVLLSTMVECLGILPFTEKQLSVSNQNTFTPAATPSSRVGRGQGLTRTPLYHLSTILSSLPPRIADDESLSDLFRLAMNPFFAAKSPKAKLDLGQELMQSIPVDTMSNYGPWLFVADMISGFMEKSQSSRSSSSSDVPVGQEYRDVAKHLVRGLHSTPNLPWKHWQVLFQQLDERAVAESGDGGCAIGVIEPLAKTVAEALDRRGEEAVRRNLLQAGIELIAHANQPRDRQALDAARRRLWGTSAAGSRTASFDPFDNLYQLVNQLLALTYKSSAKDTSEETIVSLLGAVSSFLARCNSRLTLKTIVTLQHNLSLWIQDLDELYGSKQFPEIYNAVKNLWDRIVDAFTTMDSPAGLSLDTIEVLLCSAFGSKHKHIVNSVATMWNQNFEEAEKIEYPEKLKATLIAIRPHIDIVLPGLESSDGDSGRQPTFAEFQHTENDLDQSTPRGLTVNPQLPRSASRRSTPVSFLSSLDLKTRPREKTPEPARPKSARRTTTPRLRHDDSQIQFAAIESSSPSHVPESQVLTDHQREVRERQRESVALFPELQSSGQKRKREQLPELPQIEMQAEEEKATTPKTHRSFEDYVSSTPTPRRGQALAVEDNDHEMTDDIPSSPPEPRRYPLVPEIGKPQSGNNNVLDDWTFMSSPISGSPVPRRHNSHLHTETAAGAQASESNIDKIFERPIKASTDHAASSAGGDSRGPGEVVPATVESDSGALLDTTTAIAANTVRVPSTPPSARLEEVQATPKSDHDVFVDALTSPRVPLPRIMREREVEANETGPRATNPKERSFETIASDEASSMLRKVFELESVKREPSQELPAMPDAVPAHANTQSTARDCITVQTDSEASPHKTKGSQAAATTSSGLSTSPEPSIARVRGRRMRKKRKRGTETSQELAGAKKQKQLEATDDCSLTVPASPGLLTHDNEPLATTKRPRLSSDVPSSPQPLAFTGSAAEREAEQPRRTQMDDSEAVHLQLIHEASQTGGDAGSHPVMGDENSGSLSGPPSDVVMTSSGHADLSLVIPAGVATGMDMASTNMSPDRFVSSRPAALQESIEDHPASRPALSKSGSLGLPSGGDRALGAAPRSEETSMAKVMAALKTGLDGLRSAALTREEVYKVESMFMDIKRELYEAESRGRSSA